MQRSELSQAARRRRPRRWVKEGVFAACSLLARLNDRSATPPCAILGYHSHAPGNPWATDVDEFERQLAFLSKNYRLIRLADLPEEPARRSEAIACLTFDDGYLDHYERTLPVLERVGVRATFFVVPTLLGGRIRTSSGEEPLMTAEHALELVRLGHELGSHTLTHASLTELSLGRAATEIVDSKRTLEDLLGRSVTSLAYPKGRANETVRRLAREAGYRVAVTTRETLVPPDPDWFDLPRVSVHRGVGPIQFRAQLTSALHVYNRVRGRPT